MVSFIGPVAPRSGGTLILSGSPRLLIQQERRIPASQRGGSGASLWERFHRSHPWLMALTGQAPSPADRTAAFMDEETIVEGVPLRVVELTGEPETWSSAIPSWSTAALRTAACGRASCGSSSSFSPIKVASRKANGSVRTPAPASCAHTAIRGPNCRGSGRAGPRCRFSSSLSLRAPLTWAWSRLLTDLSPVFSHRSVIILGCGRRGERSCACHSQAEIPLLSRRVITVGGRGSVGALAQPHPRKSTPEGHRQVPPGDRRVRGGLGD